MKGTKVPGTAKERKFTAERFPRLLSPKPTRSPAVKNRGVFPALRGSSGAQAQFGWYHGFLRPIVDGEVYFFAARRNFKVNYFCLTGGMELLQWNGQG